VRTSIARSTSTALAVGLALTSAALTTGSASAAVAQPATVSMQTQSVLGSGWYPVGVQNLVFSEYGGPTTIGSTQAEYIYLYCQQDGTWGWWTLAFVPSLQSYGWIRNGDITGYTNPIWGLNYC
jgi:hypothetical protein